MNQTFNDLFKKYPVEVAPFLHQQYLDWQRSKPFNGLRVLHHVPLVQNTLLKIACLVEAGAQVVITNPDFMQPCPQALQILRNENVPFIKNIAELAHQEFDIYFDCGAALYETLGAPRIGAIELTESGDTLYRQKKLDFPVISIDRSLTKQLETVFGMAVSAAKAIELLTKKKVDQLSWLIFGFGKIGRGLAYYCKESKAQVQIADINPNACKIAQQLNLSFVDARVLSEVDTALQKADIVITATGCKNALSHYPKEWFSNKILANVGILDEFGEAFTASEVLNAKKPINFILEDPTPIEYIDPELYAHNQVGLELLNHLFPGIYSMSSSLDSYIIDSWCQHHHVARSVIDSWFLKYTEKKLTPA